MPARSITGMLVALSAAAPTAADAAATRGDPSLAAYHGLAAWVDIYDAEPGSAPSGPCAGSPART